MSCSRCSLLTDCLASHKCDTASERGAPPSIAFFYSPATPSHILHSNMGRKLSPAWESSVRHVFKHLIISLVLQTPQWEASPIQMHAFTTSAKQCGRRITTDGVQHDALKLQKHIEMERPKKWVHLQQFLCVIQWLSWAIQKMSKSDLWPSLVLVTLMYHRQNAHEAYCTFYTTRRFLLEW